MKLYTNEFCIGLHSKCNWNCSYCIARNNNISYDESEILENIEPIKNKLGYVYLSGGEPGILSVDFWDKLFGLTDHKLSICTNGTFIKNGYHLRYENQIREIIIHCVQELDHDIDEEVLGVITSKNQYKIVPNIVLHNKNSHLLDEFLCKYDFEFSLFFTDSSFIPFNDKPYEYAIQGESCLSIYKNLAKNSEYSEYSNRLLRAIIKKDYRFLNSLSERNREL